MLIICYTEIGFWRFSLSTFQRASILSSTIFQLLTERPHSFSVFSRYYYMSRPDLNDLSKTVNEWRNACGSIHIWVCVSVCPGSSSSSFFFLKSRDTETGRQTELISSFPLQMPVIDRAGPAWCWRAENSIQVSYVGERGPATGATYLRVSSWLELRVELRLQPRHLDMRFAVPTGILTPMPHAHPRLDSLLKERGLRWEHRQEVSYNDIFIFRYFPRKSY